MAEAPVPEYTTLLSLDRAKLFTSNRENHLGTEELILDYQLQTNRAREDAKEWLAENRLELTDPTISYKTFEGTWKCVSIGYAEDGTTIRQTFKIDSSMTNDVSQRSDAGTVWRDYYWRIVDPTEYNIPAWTTETTGTPDLNGEYWYDTHTDLNGETVYRTEAADYSLWNNGTLWIVSTVAGEGGTPASYYSSTDIEGSYSATGWTGTLSVGFDSEYEWSKTANDNGDGTYDVTITRSLANNQEATSSSKVGGETTAGAAEDSIIVYQSSDSNADGEYTLTSGTGPPDFYDGTPSANDTRVWTNANSYTISYVEDGLNSRWRIRTNLSAEIHVKYSYNLNSFGWRNGSDSSNTPGFVIVQVGVNQPLYTEETETDTSTEEGSFVSDGGSITDPTIGQEKSISNRPNGDGTFQVTVTTRTMNYQRIPAMEDSIIYGGDGPTSEAYEDRDHNAFIWARNATYEQYQYDLNYMTNNKNGLSNSHTASLNKWGLIDYTIRSTEIG